MENSSFSRPWARVIALDGRAPQRRREGPGSDARPMRWAPRGHERVTAQPAGPYSDWRVSGLRPTRRRSRVVAHADAARQARIPRPTSGAGRGYCPRGFRSPVREPPRIARYGVPRAAVYTRAAHRRRGQSPHSGRYVFTARAMVGQGKSATGAYRWRVRLDTPIRCDSERAWGTPHHHACPPL